MSGLFRRIRRTRAAAAEDSRTDPPAPSEPQDASTTAPGGAYSLLSDPAAQPTEVQAAPPSEQPLAEMHDLPAGLEVEELRSPRHSTERRSRLRRRTRYLRRVRELLLRDLGGIVYEISRVTGGETPHHKELVHAKTQRLAALDAELFALEDRLGEGHPPTVLREPGVGGLCPTCGELHSSDAKFCSACGSPLTGHAAAAPEGERAKAQLPAPAEPERPTEASGAEDRPTEVGTPDESPRPEDPPTEVSAPDESPRSEDQPTEVSVAEESPASEESPAAEQSPASEESPDSNGRGGTTNGRSADNDTEWAWPAERPR